MLFVAESQSLCKKVFIVIVVKIVVGSTIAFSRFIRRLGLSPKTHALFNDAPTYSDVFE